ncbi:MAG: hypothetical protein LBK42_08220 [Propionibacteriaceae bacterium]|nr:hypothetical protein [Propionibacteriaceae bacterium]
MASQLPPVRPMRLTFGGRVPDRDIVGRDETADSLWGDLVGNSFQISEMRRFGKSTILRLMESRAPEGWLCVRTTMQDVLSTSDLLELTLNELLGQTKVKTKIKRHVERGLLSFVKQVDGIEVNAKVAKVSLSPQIKRSACQTFRSLLESLAADLRKDDAYLAIMWDEFPDSIAAIQRNEGAAAARDVLALLKASRQSDDGQRIRWVFTGSIGFHHVQRALGGHGQEMGDVTVRDIGPLTPEWTSWLAAALLMDIGLEDEPAARALAGVAEGVPFVVEMMVKYLRDNLKSASRALPQDGAAAQKLLLAAAGDPAIGANWTPLLTKVEDYYQDKAPLAEAILDAVARSPQTLAEVTAGLDTAAPDQRTVRQVMDLLLSDRYLAFDQASALYSWRHRPLQLIWRARRRDI